MKCTTNILEKTTENYQVYLKKYASIAVFSIILIIFSVTLEGFLSVTNIINILTQMSLLAIVATGLTFCIITNEWDLSVGSVTGLAGVMTAVMFKNGFTMVPAIVTGLAVGLGFGLLNGLIITKFRVPSLITTIATGLVALGINHTFSGNVAVYGGMSDHFIFIGQGKIGIIPFPIIILLVVFMVSKVLLDNYRVGTYLYTIGGNRVAARFSGININIYLILAFAVSGLCSGISGIISASVFASAQPSLGQNFVLVGIASVFLGKTMFRNGEPNLLGTLIGVLIITVITNGFSLAGLEFYYQDIAKALIILIAVGIGSITTK